MKKAFIIAVIIFLTYTARAQVQIGASAGTNLSTMSISLRDRSTFRINPEIGYNADIVVEYKFRRNFSLWTGMSLTQKGFSQFIKYFYSPIIDSTASIVSKLSYLEVPVYLKFNTEFDKVDLFYGIGPYISYGFHGTITTEITGRNDIEITEKMKWDKSNTYSDLVNNYRYANIRRPDFGVGTMLGLKYRSFFAVASYKYGLRNVMWEYFQDEKMSNASLSFSVGYIFKEKSEGTDHKLQKTLEPLLR